MTVKWLHEWHLSRHHGSALAVDAPVGIDTLLTWPEADRLAEGALHCIKDEVNAALLSIILEEVRESIVNLKRLQAHMAVLIQQKRCLRGCKAAADMHVAYASGIDSGCQTTLCASHMFGRST